MLSKPADQLRIIARDQEKVFEDEATIGDQEVQNGEIVYVVFKTGESTYENIQVSTGNITADDSGGKS